MDNLSKVGGRLGGGEERACFLVGWAGRLQEQGGDLEGRVFEVGRCE